MSHWYFNFTLELVEDLFIEFFQYFNVIEAIVNEDLNVLLQANVLEKLLYFLALLSYYSLLEVGFQVLVLWLLLL